MDLSILNKPLTRDDIDFRISHLVGKDVVYAIILAYKDARVDMRILDEACGQLEWKNTYQRDSKGVLQCTISIYNETIKEWISKTSNGVESFTESQKGEYSDAFKRAGFMWGIGRGLYDFCFIMVTLTQDEYYAKDGKNKASNKLRPNDWDWEISEDYKDVKAWSKFGSTKEIRFDSKGRVKAKKEPKNETKELMEALEELNNVNDIFQLEEVWKKYTKFHTQETFKLTTTNLKATLTV